MTSLWVQEAAARFWADAGGVPPVFPRDPRRAVALALPLAVVDLPRLGVGAVAAWLAQRGGRLPLATRNRALRACLLAHAGVGAVFLEGADPDDERRFSLAHETAHFLVEHLFPRERAVAHLGGPALALLDGRRAATADERVDALLAGVPLGTTVHLMERTPDGHPPAARVSEAEQQADALAVELLAPSDVVRAALDAQVSRAAAEALLVERFGLPPAVARAHARALVPDHGASLAARLGWRTLDPRVEVPSSAGNTE